jgi:hypothetical protein
MAEGPYTTRIASPAGSNHCADAGAVVCTPALNTAAPIAARKRRPKPPEFSGTRDTQPRTLDPLSSPGGPTAALGGAMVARSRGRRVVRDHDCGYPRPRRSDRLSVPGATGRRSLDCKRV